MTDFSCLGRARQYDSLHAAAMLDLEKFQAINDSHNHHDGDNVLRKVSELCEQSCCSMDIVGRIGVATLTAESTDGNKLLRLADQALYQAKRAGRNRVSVA
jgi:GGDEF domain-containing protein